MTTIGARAGTEAVASENREADGGAVALAADASSLRGNARFLAFAAAGASLRSLAQTVARLFGSKDVCVAHADFERARPRNPPRVDGDGLLALDAIAETYWALWASADAMQDLHP